MQDVEQLSQALKKLDAIHDSINATGLAGKAGLIHLTVEVYRAIERVLAKEVGQVQRWQALQQAEANGDQGAELAAGDGEQSDAPGPGAAVEG